MNLLCIILKKQLLAFKVQWIDYIPQFFMCQILIIYLKKNENEIFVKVSYAIPEIMVFFKVEIEIKRERTWVCKSNLSFIIVHNKPIFIQEIIKFKEYKIWYFELLSCIYVIYYPCVMQDVINALIFFLK